MRQPVWARSQATVRPVTSAQEALSFQTPQTASPVTCVRSVTTVRPVLSCLSRVLLASTSTRLAPKRSTTASSACKASQESCKQINRLQIFILYVFILGQYCGSPGLEYPTGDCDEGFYCPRGQNVSSPPDFICTPGHYCPRGSPDQIDCEAGTFQDQFGQVNKFLYP